eukprot:6192158-Pleurochrysis_carterae.AAC.1
MKNRTFKFLVRLNRTLRETWKIQGFGKIRTCIMTRLRTYPSSVCQHYCGSIKLLLGISRYDYRGMPDVYPFA